MTDVLPALKRWLRSIVFTPAEAMKPITSIATVVLLSCSAISFSPAALADDDAKINARINSWAVSCKNAVAAKYPKSTMADISVELGATLKESIDAGTTTLKDIKKGGLSYSWTFRNHSGYCNTDGNGNVQELKKF
jgi:hypothetical protein